MDHLQQYFDLYVSAMKRCRWLLISTTTIAALILADVYVTQYSFQRAQLVSELTDMSRYKGDRRLKNLQAFLDTVSSNTNTQSISDSAELYTLFRVQQSRISNLLSKSDYGGTPKLPILGSEVPGLDYTPILVMFLTAMYAAAWFSYRTVSATRTHVVQQFQNEPNSKHIIDLTRLHFIFTGALDHNERYLSGFVQYGAFVAPPLIVLVAFLFDIAPIWDRLAGTNIVLAGHHDLILRFAIQVICFVIQAILAVSIIGQVHRVRKEIISETTSAQ